MPFQRGHKQFGGRKPGTINRVTKIRNRIMSVDVDVKKVARQFPIDFLKLQSQFIPKPPVEQHISGANGGPLQVESVLFSRKADAKD